MTDEELDTLINRAEHAYATRAATVWSAYQVLDLALEIRALRANLAKHTPRVWRRNHTDRRRAREMLRRSKTQAHAQMEDDRLDGCWTLERAQEELMRRKQAVQKRPAKRGKR